MTPPYERDDEDKWPKRWLHISWAVEPVVLFFSFHFFFSTNTFVLVLTIDDYTRHDTRGTTRTNSPRTIIFFGSSSNY
jgi:hypothetical protein